MDNQQNEQFDSINPYESPASPAVPLSSTEGVRLTSSMIANLKGASPWLRFLGVLGFIGTGFIVLTGLAFIFGGGAIAALLAKADADSASSLLGAGMMGFFGVIAFAISLLYFFPSLFMYRFGSKLRAYCNTLNANELEDAFKNNYSFWKWTGVLVIIIMSFYVLAIPVGLIVGIAASL